MKKVKRILAMVMAMAMVLGMSMTTFAANNDANAKVKVSNDGVDALKYIQIVEADRSSAAGWKLCDSYASIITGAGCGLEDIIAATEKGTQERMTNSAKLSAALEALRDAETIEWKNITDSEFAATSAGLYLIMPKKAGYTFAPTLAYVPVGAQDDVTVNAKGAEDQIKKSIKTDGQSVAPGDEVVYTLSFDYPYVPANHTNPEFVITDTITNGTLKGEASNITFNNTTMANNSTVAVNTDKDGFTVTVEGDQYKPELAGTKITVIYTVIANSNVTSSNLLKNKVQSSLKLDSSSTPVTSEHEVTSATVKFTVKKTDDATSNPKPLNGAKFALYVADDNGDQSLDVSGQTVKAKKVTEKVTAGTGDAEGTATFDGLDAQKTYYVKEVEAPKGYSVNDTVYELKGALVGKDEEKSNATTTIYTSANFNDQPVVDTALSALPSTGGIGTTIFTIGGCVIMIAAAAMFFANRKKEQK